MLRVSGVLFSLLLFLILTSTSPAEQVLNTYGIQSGFTTAWQSNEFGGEKVETIQSKNGFLIGFFAEWLKGPWYSVKTELNYAQKGAITVIPITTIDFPEGTGEFLRQEQRLDYVSMIIAPRIYTKLQNVKLYALAGPRIDFEVARNYTFNGPEPHRSELADAIDNSTQSDFSERIQLGLTGGIGIQLYNVVPFAIGLEARFNPDISTVDRSRVIDLWNNTIDILFTIEL